ncbi:hypothetical protein GCM10023205_03850 [Yinghuangia aomiensis]|uniref:Uncharacterized protein n=1 Tax=Yinghuangia aomiensis TaxID=676205 RepID=A0ABP9GTA0_9ACTN
MLVLGMDEDRRTRLPTRVRPVDVTDHSLTKITATATRNILPVPAGIALLEKKVDPADHEGILLIVVAPSPGAPHQILASGEPAGYPRRHGTTTVQLKEHEIDTAYRRRHAAQADRAARLDQVESDVFRARARSSSGPLITVSLVPDLPGNLTLDQQTVERLRRSAADDRPLVGRQHLVFRHTAVGHRRVVHTSDGPRGRNEFHAELHTDGSGSWGRWVNRVSTRAHPYGGTDSGFDLDTLVHTVASALGHLARHAAFTAGCSGTAALRVQACVDAHLYLEQDQWPAVDKRLAEGNWAYLMQRLSAGKPEYEAVAPERRWLATGESRALIDDLADGRGPLVSAAAELLGDLVQNYGMVEVPHLTRDGAVRPAAWLGNETATAANWVLQHRLDAVD